MAALKEINIPQEGDTFDTFEVVDHQPTLLGLSQGLSPGVLMSDSGRMVFNCRSSATCPWHAREWKGNGPRVKFSVLAAKEVHTCAGQLDPFRPTHAKKAFLVKIIPMHMTVTSSTKAEETMDCLKKNYNTTVQKTSIYTAKAALLSMSHSDLTKQVQQIPAFFTQLEQKDPETVTQLETQSDGSYRRCLLIPGPAPHAFKHCRPIVALDGTFVKSKMKGTLLLAARFDGNDSLLILAWAIVTTEIGANWMWFVQYLNKAIPELNRPTSTVISDRVAIRFTRTCGIMERSLVGRAGRLEERYEFGPEVGSEVGKRVRETRRRPRCEYRS